MSEEQIEQLLQRYRPAPPDPFQRDRVLAAASKPYRVPLGAVDWTLLGAAAVLLVAAAVTLQPAPAVVRDDPARRAGVALTAAALGGSDMAQRIAEAVVPPTTL